MNGALLTALERIEREKGIDKDILFEAIESALVSAARKVIDDPDVAKEDITVTMDKETGEIEVFSEGELVENERFGRIAAQTAKQVIIQKIREAERDVIYEKYIKKIGVIISGSVHRFEKGTVIVELDDTEAILPKSGQIPRERFRQGEQMRAYLLKVERGSSGPEIVLSRTDEGFVRKLFELEVPEISQGIVEIKAIAREAGERTKIAVHSKDEKVDPVGACVGMRGSRVRDIVKELHGERIDIIRWYDDIRDYIPAAVSPAEVTRMVIDRENEKITLTVPRDQLSLLIGKKGRNIRLASKLLGWELVAEAAREALGIPISEIKGITKKAQEALEEFGYDDIDKLIEAGVEGIVNVKGIGEKTAEKIFAFCEEVYAAAIKEKEAQERAAREEEEKAAQEPEVEKKEEEVAEKASGEETQEEVAEEAEEAEEEAPEEAKDETEETEEEKPTEADEAEDKG
ncbi:transcription termination factor NusA [Candidatus Omnitrophota bacterium]